MNNITKMQKSPLFTDPQKNKLNRVENEEGRTTPLVYKKVKEGDAKVHISDLVKDFAKIKMAVDRAEDIDNSARVEKLKEEIAAGRYKIDDDFLAERILLDEF